MMWQSTPQLHGCLRQTQFQLVHQEFHTKLCPKKSTEEQFKKIKKKKGYGSHWICALEGHKNESTVRGSCMHFVASHKPYCAKGTDLCHPPNLCTRKWSDIMVETIGCELEPEPLQLEFRKRSRWLVPIGQIINLPQHNCIREMTG